MLGLRTGYEADGADVDAVSHVGTALAGSRQDGILSIMWKAGMNVRDFGLFAAKIPGQLMTFVKQRGLGWHGVLTARLVARSQPWPDFVIPIKALDLYAWSQNCIIARWGV